MTGLMTASLDHAMWFHRPFSFDEWILLNRTHPPLEGREASTEEPCIPKKGS